MTIYSLVIINKAGGLIYNKNFHETGLKKISTNDLLVLAGTFHGVHAITARLNPIKPPHSVPITGAGTGASSIPSRPEPPSGLEVLESENFRLQCFSTLTGTKFLLFTDSAATPSGGSGGAFGSGSGGAGGGVDVAVRKIYDLYADYVMKNPFYQLEMPVRCELFDRKLASYVREVNNR